jgi:hypothetical protein
VTYLDELPRCPTCDRILRTKNGALWCIECFSFVDQPVIPAVLDGIDDAS